jgi:hypothetical protein
MVYKVIFKTGETREYENLAALCKGLSISTYTVYGIINGTCMFKEQHTKPLKGIKIITPHITEDEVMEKVRKADNLFKERETIKTNEEIEFHKKKIEECERYLASL